MRPFQLEREAGVRGIGCEGAVVGRLADLVVRTVVAGEHYRGSAGPFVERLGKAGGSLEIQKLKHRADRRGAPARERELRRGVVDLAGAAAKAALPGQRLRHAVFVVRVARVQKQRSRQLEFVGIADEETREITQCQPLTG